MNLKDKLNKKNVAREESIARMAVGFLMFAGGVFKSMPLIGIAGLILFITGVRRNCLLYILIDKDTNKK